MPQRRALTTAPLQRLLANRSAEIGLVMQILMSNPFHKFGQIIFLALRRLYDNATGRVHPSSLGPLVPLSALPDGDAPVWSSGKDNNLKSPITIEVPERDAVDDR
jgi:hypothetical protein